MSETKQDRLEAELQQLKRAGRARITWTSDGIRSGAPGRRWQRIRRRKAELEAELAAMKENGNA